MYKSRLYPALMPVLLLGFVFLACGHSANDSAADKLANFYKKDKVVVLVTDSGLGGLSVMADIAGKFEKEHPFKEVQLIFANALADTNYLYNQMSSTDEKVGVFNDALTGMTQNYHPDIIMIACNTLSVIYPLTEFSRSTEIPVIDIVDFGVKMMLDYLHDHPDDAVVIMGTPTTIAQDSHCQRLIDAGIAPERIVTQPCDMLESEIQNDPESDITETMIDMYASEAVDKLPAESGLGLGVGLCCTHYGYSGKSFESSFATLSGKNVKVLNPNTAMSRFLFRPEYDNRYESTGISARVVSRVPISKEAVASIGKMLSKDSEPVAEALRSYELNRNLFTYSKYSADKSGVSGETGDR